MPEYGIKMNRRFTQRALCGKWYETVAAWLGEYHLLVADVVDCWQVLELTSNLHNAHV